MAAPGACDRDGGAERFRDRVGDRARLPVRVRRREDEVIRHGRDFGEIENEDGGGVLVEGGGQAFPHSIPGGERVQRCVTPGLYRPCFVMYSATATGKRPSGLAPRDSSSLNSVLEILTDPASKTSSRPASPGTGGTARTLPRNGSPKKSRARASRTMSSASFHP